MRTPVSHTNRGNLRRSLYSTAIQQLLSITTLVALYCSTNGGRRSITLGKAGNVQRGHVRPGAFSRSEAREPYSRDGINLSCIFASCLMDKQAGRFSAQTNCMLRTYTCIGKIGFPHFVRDKG